MSGKEIRTGLDVRLGCRNGTLRGHTSGVAKGNVQANIAVVPSKIAGDFKRFCELNYGPLPLLYVSKPGETGAPPLAEDSDVRSDLGAYHAIIEGKTIESQNSLVEYPWDGMVTFYLGCSYSFEENLLGAGLSIRNVDERKMAAVFVTTIICHLPAKDTFTCPMYCTARPFKVEDLKKVITITATTPSAHGCPVHIGDPSRVGVEDILKCDFGHDITVDHGEVPVFWGCGFTCFAALKAAAPEIGFIQKPGNMYVSDVPVSEWDKKKDVQVPDILVEEILPGFYSYISEEIAAKIQTLQGTVLSGDTPEGSLLRALLILSHSSKVIILVPSQPKASDVLRCLSLVSTLSAFNVKTTLLTPDEETSVLLRKCFDVLNDRCLNLTIDNVVQERENFDVCMTFDPSPGITDPLSFDVNCLLAFHHSASRPRFTSDVPKRASLLSLATKDASSASGSILSAGLFCAMQCSMHWRYRQHAIGDRKAQATFGDCLPMNEQVLAKFILPLKSTVDAGESVEEYLKVLQSLEEFCSNF